MWLDRVRLGRPNIKGCLSALFAVLRISSFHQFPRYHCNQSMESNAQTTAALRHLEDFILCLGSIETSNFSDVSQDIFSCDR